MKFSVIMPCYKTQTRLVREAVESVRGQSWSEWELVIVDDNAAESRWKQEMRNLASELGDEPRIRVLFHADNRGANAARNTAIEASSGDWLAFLDADDRWDCDYLSTVSDAVRKSPDCALVTTTIRIDNGHGVRVMPPCCVEGHIYEQEIMGDLISPSSGVCVQKDALLAAGSFDATLPARQDYDMWLRVCREHSVASIGEAKVTVNRDGHASISKDKNKHMRGTLAVLEKIKADQRLTPAQKRQVEKSHLRYLWRLCMKEGNSRSALEFAAKTLPGPSGFARVMVSPLAPLAKGLRSLCGKTIYT